MIGSSSCFLCSSGKYSNSGSSTCYVCTEKSAIATDINTIMFVSESSTYKIRQINPHNGSVTTVVPAFISLSRLSLIVSLALLESTVPLIGLLIR